METTYCETCLQFSFAGGACRLDDCAPSKPTEFDGYRALNSKGYRLAFGAIWHIKNDDPDNFQEDKVAEWDGSAVDAFRMLIRHGFPTSSDIPCASCRDAEVEFLGDLCAACSLERADWIKAGEYL